MTKTEIRITSAAERIRYALAQLAAIASERCTLRAADAAAGPGQDPDLARATILADTIAAAWISSHLLDRREIERAGAAWTLDCVDEAVAASGETGIPLVAGHLLAYLAAIAIRPDAWAVDLATMPLDPCPHAPSLPSLKVLRHALADRLSQVDASISARRELSGTPPPQPPQRQKVQY